VADTLDVLTLDEAKAAANVAGVTAYDLELPAWITAVSRRLDDAVGPIVRRTITSDLQDGGEGHEVRTAKYPVTSFNAVTEYQDTTATVLTRETNALKPSDAYLAEAYDPDPTLFSGRLRRRSGGSDSYYPQGRRNVEITYVAGRYATTASVDELFKLAARLTLLNLWNSQRPNTASVEEFDVPQSNFPRFAIPNAVRELLKAHWQEGPMVGESGLMVG
jgi:hypothetical protein